ncbi:hypothetical protein AC630_10760 [Bradyrhizobium sp. AS23.2]|nr:hypothetical protein AC630_10760 [Bradyrhizobium sp. AS23.2]
MPSFFFPRPDNPWQPGRIGTTIFYDTGKLIRAALHVRQSGLIYLRYLSLDDIWSQLQSFVVD